MPRLGGIEVVKQARSVAPETAAILYAERTEPGLLVEALDAGAAGFALKESPVTELVEAVLSAAAGDVYIDPKLAGSLVRPPKVSSREREILRLLADGKSNAEIGKALSIAPDTVRTYIRRAMTKLEAGTRTQAVATAIRRSLIS